MKRVLFALLAIVLLAPAPALAAVPHPVRPAVTHDELEVLRTRATALPYSAEAQFDLAMTALRSPALEEGWAALQRAGRLDPDWGSRVVERYAAAVTAAPGDPEARWRLAAGHYLEGDREAARRQLQLIGADPWALVYLGALQAEGGQSDRAIASWQRALQLDPGNMGAYYMLGQVWYRQGHLAKAKQAIDEAERLKSSSSL